VLHRQTNTNQHKCTYGHTPISHERVRVSCAIVSRVPQSCGYSRNPPFKNVLDANSGNSPYEDTTIFNNIQRARGPVRCWRHRHISKYAPLCRLASRRKLAINLLHFLDLGGQLKRGIDSFRRHCHLCCGIRVVAFVCVYEHTQWCVCE